MKPQTAQPKPVLVPTKTSDAPVPEDQSTLLSAPLTHQERRQLADCEHRIASGLQIFLEVGVALLVVHDNELYRESYRTFEDYCRERWEIGRAYAYRLIGAAEFTRRLSPMDDIPKPTCERHIRPLLKLPLDLASKAWRRAVNRSAGKPVTGRDVTQAIEEILGELSSPDTSKKEEASQEPSLIQHLLLRELSRARRSVSQNAIADIPAMLDHMHFLIQRYGCGAQSEPDHLVSDNRV
jgi:hypothetical protein